MAQRKGYGQFCPVAKGAEIFAERWTPLILRELLQGGCRFGEIKNGVPLCSPSLLSTRLKELERAGVIRKTKQGRTSEYKLTSAGEELRPLVELLGAWGHCHVQHRIHRDDLDPCLLMWDVRRGVDPDKMPRKQRTVVQFSLAGVPTEKSRWWLVFDRGEVDLCLTHPGYDTDLVVAAHVRALTEIWIGHRSLKEARDSNALRLEGPRTLKRSFPRWFSLSPFAQDASSTGRR